MYIEGDGAWFLMQKVAEPGTNRDLDSDQALLTLHNRSLGLHISVFKSKPAARTKPRDVTSHLAPNLSDVGSLL